MKPPLLAAALAAAILAIPAATTHPVAAAVVQHHLVRLAPPATRHCKGAREAVVFYRQAAWGWQARHDAHLTRAGHAEHNRSCPYVRWAARLWQTRARTAHRGFQRWLRDTYAKYKCIHLAEGAWTAANGSYGGGLQMDGGFQSTYGAEFLHRFGAAGRWPVWAQLLAAERAFHGYHGYGARGFGPWSTAPGCGL